MSERLTPPTPWAAPGPESAFAAPATWGSPSVGGAVEPGGPWLRTSLLQAFAVLVIFAVAAVVGGLLWWHLWTPSSGAVQDHQWYCSSEKCLRASFASTAIYAVIGAIGGLVLGFICSWLLARSELVTLVAIVLGSVLAAWLMLRVGASQSPPDPGPLAAKAANGTVLPGNLDVTSWSPYLTWPAFAMLSVTFVYFVLAPRRHR